MAHLAVFPRPWKSVFLQLVAVIAVVYVQKAASCTEEEFLCNSSKCISKDLTCDRRNDCGDFSDEINCTTRGKCNLDEIECSDGSCILSQLVCNGRWECPRGLDETNCESKTTSPTTPSFEQQGIFHGTDREVRSFPVYEKSRGISIYLRFTSQRCAGNLFEMTSQNTDQFFLLSLTGEGNIEFLFKTSLGPGMVVIPPPSDDSFCNGKRHMLSIRRYLQVLRFRVNRRRSVTKKIELLREPFSRPFRVYVGTSLQGCVSGIDVIFHHTRSKTFSVGYSKGCANPKKATPFVLDTTSSTLNLVTTAMPTTGRNKYSVRSFALSSHTSTLHIPRTTKASQATPTQPSSVTQSDDIMGPFYMDQGEVISTRLASSLRTKHVASPAQMSPTPTFMTGSSGSNSRTTGSLILNVMHSTPAMEPETATAGISAAKDAPETPTSGISTFKSTAEEFSGRQRCETLRSTFCTTYMGYNQTRLPNSAGHENQLQAEKQMSQFFPFIRSNCSRVLKDFICASYLPPCSLSTAVQPCRELCVRSKKECASLMKAFEFVWPEFLDCQKLPSSKNEKCVLAHETRTPVLPTFTTQYNRKPGKPNKIHTTKTANPIIFTKMDMRKHCGGILTRPSGIIKTPNFPEPYPSDTLCKWAIILPKVYHVIDIILEEVSLENDVNCGYDYLLFLDGLSNQVGARICGFLAYPRVITVKGNMAFIVFKSDSALNKKGVHIKYTAHCPFLSCSGNDVTLVTQYFPSHVNKSPITIKPNPHWYITDSKV